MDYSLRQKLGALVFDAPAYLFRLALSKLGMRNAWLLIRNRQEAVITSRAPFGVNCQWQWTSDLYLPKIFTLFSQLLIKQALSSSDFGFSETPNLPKENEAAEVCFVIGHRGRSRLPLLLKTIESIASQQGCTIECVVVEYDNQSTLKNALPNWVRYLHKSPEKKDQKYNRALAFNIGAQATQSNCVIFHDNDLLISKSYAAESLKLVQAGFDFVNLKRFIFYLSPASSEALRLNAQLNGKLEIESIMQNAEGGGSIACSLTAFKAIGGFDQRFIGWGGEDNEFWERAQTKNVWLFGNQCLIHQWHEAQSEKEDLDKAPTLALYRELSAQSPKDRIKWLNENQKIDHEAKICAV